MSRQQAAAAAAAGKKRDNCLSEIQRLEKDRDDRRRNMEERKQERATEEARNRANGNMGDIDFQRMIKEYREEQVPPEEPHSPPGEMKICICIRKRPINSKEIKKRDHDAVTCSNPLVAVHDCKLKVDGITKYLDNNIFRMDHIFGEDDTTDDIYMYAVQPLADFVLDGGRATVFAYGQTGSGKTFTMTGIQKFIVEDLFHLFENDSRYQSGRLEIGVSFFEIYGGRCQDLLNNRHRLEIREDGNGEVQIAGLEELIATNSDTMLNIIDMGNKNRTTHATESNDVSSRSHAICQIMIRNNGKIIGKLSLIDLAGSERGADTKSHNRQRRMEGAEINKSLLALKECIRALDCNSTHIPYRASKLTLVLKDSFTNKNSRTVMIVNISPAASSADHTLNTLRYADRVKEKKAPINNGGGGIAAAKKPPSNQPSSVPQSVPPAPAQPMRRRSGSNNDFAEKQEKPSSNPSGRRGWDRGGVDDRVAVGKPPSHNQRAAPAQRPYEDEVLDDDEDAYDEGSEDSNFAANNNIKQRKADIHQLHMSLRQEHLQDRGAPSGGGAGGRNQRDRKDEKNAVEESEEDGFNNEADDEVIEVLHQTIEDLFEEEEELLNIHMNVIQENAELLTEEGRLLQQIQGDDVIDYDIEAYANRLDEILKRKYELIVILQKKLKLFKRHLKKEEHISRGVQQMPSY